MPTAKPTNNAQTDWKKNEIGVLWKRKSKGGQEYFNGNIVFKQDIKAGQQVSLICFSNREKKSDNQPDVRIYISEKPGTTANTSVANKIEAKSNAANQKAQQAAEDTTDSEAGVF